MRSLRSVYAFAVIVFLAASGTAQQRWYETARLLPELGFHDQLHGAALALDGDTALVGAPVAWGPIGGSFGAGSVRVFVRQGGEWSQEAELDTPFKFNGGNFGGAVALDGDTAVIGLPALNGSGTLLQGGVAVFVRSAGTWVYEASFLAPDPQPTTQRFGAAVAVSGDTMVVGAPDADEGPTMGPGAVYIFTRSAGVWTQQARLLSPQPQQHAAFGTDLDLEGDTLLVGEPYASPAAHLTSSGAARVFTRSAGVWSFDQTLLSLDAAAWDSAGSVALSGDRAVLGSPGALGPGELTTFVRQGGTWVADELLFDLVYNGKGRSVDISGDTVVTGTLAFIAEGQRPGAVLYDAEPSGWQQQPVAWSRDGFTGAENNYESAVFELDGDTLLVGVPNHDGSAEEAGMVHVFTRDGPWADHEHALKGTSFQPPLLYAAGSLGSASGNELLLAGIPGGGAAYIVASATDLSVPFKGGVLVPAPDVILGPVALPDAIGEALSLPFHMPVVVPSGFTFYMQYWFADAGAPQGFAASNALSGTTP